MVTPDRTRLTSCSRLFLFVFLPFVPQGRRCSFGRAVFFVCLDKKQSLSPFVFDLFNFNFDFDFTFLWCLSDRRGFRIIVIDSKVPSVIFGS